MNILNNRKVAWIVLALCVVGSIVGMGGGSLAAQRREALRVFDAGIDDSFAVRFSMDAYLDNCAKYAGIMAEEYRLYVDREGKPAENALELLPVISDGEELDKRYEAYKALCAEVETLYTDFHAAKLSDADMNLFKEAYMNFMGEVSKIEYDEYHVLAKKFNTSLEGFPANLVSSMLGVEPLNSF